MATPTLPRTCSSTPSATPPGSPQVESPEVGSAQVHQPGPHHHQAQHPHHPHHPRRRPHRFLTGVMLLLTMLFAGYPNSLIGSMVWWSLDSGPFARAPRDILTETSPVDAVRVFGDHPGMDATHAARQTVDTLDAAGGFERSVVAVMIPTGSGWVDPKEVEALEKETKGDMASVSVRYSSAPSAAVWLMHRDLAAESATALITEVVDRINSLPTDTRPQIIVHGQSLGASVGVDALTADPHLNDAISARLWQGIPGGIKNPAPTDRCTVSAMNSDDPVGTLSASLLTNPLEAARVVRDLPGSENKPSGSGHSYRPVLPPVGCIG